VFNHIQLPTTRNNNIHDALTSLPVNLHTVLAEKKPSAFKDVLEKCFSASWTNSVWSTAVITHHNKASQQILKVKSILNQNQVISNICMVLL